MFIESVNKASVYDVIVHLVSKDMQSTFCDVLDYAKVDYITDYHSSNITDHVEIVRNGELVALIFSPSELSLFLGGLEIAKQLKVFIKETVQ